MQAVLAAVAGFLEDINAEKLSAVGRVRVVIVVTGGRLYRGWLDDDGDVRIEEITTSHVAFRRGVEPGLKRCIITTEPGLQDLIVRADRTTKLLLPRLGAG